MRSGGGSGRVTQSIKTGTTTVSSSNTSGTTSTAPAKIIPTITDISISPESVIVDKGKTHQFTATVSGTNDPDLTVTWTVSNNTSAKTTINEDGLLTVGSDENITPLTVIATSNQDKSKKASAAVTVPGGISAINVNSVATWNTAINTIRNGGNNQTYIINVTGKCCGTCCQ